MTMTTNSDYKKRFYEKYVSALTASLYSEEATTATIKRRFTAWDESYGKFLPKDKGANIIDLGCGFGDVVYWLQRRGYAHAQGIDISPEQIAKGTKLGIRNLAVGDALTFLEGSRNAYDAIFLFDTLFLFTKEEAFRFTETALRALKPGGVLVIKSANAESPMTGRLRYSDFTSEINITGNSLKQLLTVAGFSEVAIYPLRPVVHGVKSFVRYFLWTFVIEALLRLYRLIEAGDGSGIFTQNVIGVGKKR